MIDNAAIQRLLVECAQSEILPYFQKLAAHDIRLKDNAVKDGEDVVTVVDHNVEAWMAKRLQALVPGSLVIGEEDCEADPSVMEKAAHHRHVWIIDPVDGTKNFSVGHPDFAMMLAYVEDGEVVGAWIYAPVPGKMASWVKGGAVCVNGRPCVLNTTSKALGDMTGGEHVSYIRPADRAQIRASRARHFGACISRSCVGVEWIMMVEGELDFVSFGVGNPWDIAAGAAMVAAMGGSALNLQQQKLQGDALFTVKGAMLATRSPEDWLPVRDAMLEGINWGKYFV